jgi:hypothetical protein
MSRYSAIKKALAQVAKENYNTDELQVLRHTLLAQQEVPHYDTEDGSEPFQNHEGPLVVHAWSGIKEDHNTFEDVMSTFGHSDTGYAGRGLYGGSKSVGKRYAEKPGRKLKSVTFKFSNPLIRTRENWRDPIMPYDWIPKRTLELEEQGLDWTSAKLRASDEYPQMLKEKGYDGFIDAATKPEEMGEIVAYHPETIEIHDSTVHAALVNEFIRLAGENEKPKISLDWLKNKPETTPQTQQTPEPTPEPKNPKPKISLDWIKNKPETTPAQTPAPVPPAQTPTAPAPPAQTPQSTSAQKDANNIPGLSGSQTQRMQALRDAIEKQQQGQNNTELQTYIQSNPVPEKLQALVASGNALLTMPKPGTPLDAMPSVPDAAYDEVADMTIEDVGAVSYPDGKPVYAAFGDKAEYEGILKAAGFKPMVVYFFPKPTAKTNNWRNAKHANMYVSVGTAGKDAVEAAWSNPNHPVALAGRREQAAIDSRREESEQQRRKYQENIDRVQRTRQPYSAEGYNEDNHRKSYAHVPHRTTAIPIPKKIAIGKDDAQLQYLPYQIAAVDFINQRLGGRDDAKPDAERGVILADSPGIGKAQPITTPVLTPNGWKPIGEIKIGDDIFAGDGTVTKVTGVFPQGEKEVFEIVFTDNSSTECCDEHLWVVNTPYRIKHELPARVKSLKQIKDLGLMSSGKRQHYIPIVKEVQFEYKELSVDPYVLGCILGDGSITQRQILFSTKDEELLEEIQKRIPNSIVINPTDDRGCNFRFASTENSNLLIRQLKNLGIWGDSSDNKHVPKMYLFAHAKARMELLQGLMDTDGTVLQHNSIQFTSNSLELINNVAFLVESLGGVCRITSKISASGKAHHIATIKISKCPFKLKRKAQKWKPHLKYPASRAIKDIRYSRIDECVCISVEHESKTYLTERCIVTHNTMPAIGVISTNPSIKKVLVVCPSVMVPVWIREMRKWLAGDHVRNPVTNRLTVTIGRYNKNEDLPDITVMSYESLNKASKDISNPERIGGRAWDYVILDESHRVKDEHSVQACVIMGGRPKRRKTENPLIPESKAPGRDDGEYPGVPSKRRLLLTGTPIPSYAWELYANLRFVRPDIFNNEDEFMYQFAVMKAFRTTAWRKNKNTGAPELHRLFITKPVRPQNMTLLNKLLFGGGTYTSGSNRKHFDGIIMRRIHKDLEALGDQYTWPPKTKPTYRAIVENQDNTGLDARTAELSSLEQKIIEAKNKGATQDELAELEHEYNDKVKVSFQRVAKVRNAIGMKKAPYAAAEAAIQARGTEEGRPNQVLVFAYHKNVIETIAAGIEQQFIKMGHPEWKVAIVYGATSDKKREETFEQFQNDPNVKAIVASYKVLKEGITLTAANKVIHAELMPNPIDYEQAYARAWRRGQDRHVSETYMWLPKTFDERLYTIASGKFAAANKILNHRLPVPKAE